MRKHKINDKEKRRQEARQRQGRGKAEGCQEVNQMIYQSNKKSAM